MIRRRTFLTALAGVLALALAAEAQQAGKVARIGLLLEQTPVSDMLGPEPRAAIVRAFLNGLRDLGYAEGQNIVIERRSAEGKLERLPGLAAELVRLNVDVIVASGERTTPAVTRATNTIPIVQPNLTAPLERGYRLKGELLLAGSAGPHAEVEACFHEAIDVARRQAAKSLELRAATSLSRLWQRQGKRADARRLLGEVYGWFTEGFETADLREATALVEELA